jgi:hypothetical protein
LVALALAQTSQYSGADGDATDGGVGVETEVGVAGLDVGVGVGDATGGAGVSSAVGMAVGGAGVAARGVGAGAGAGVGAGADAGEGGAGRGASRPSATLPRIPYSSLAYVRKLGKGAYGEVGEYLWLGTPVAVKVNGLEASDEAALDKEVELYSRLSPHPHVVAVMGICRDALDQKVRLVMRLCPKGSLEDWLASERRRMDEEGREVCAPQCVWVVGRCV